MCENIIIINENDDNDIINNINENDSNEI